MHRRRVMEHPIIYVGLDVHKDTIAVALAEAGLRGEVREHGKIPNTPAALKALTVKLVGKNRALRFCYEGCALEGHRRSPVCIARLTPRLWPADCSRWPSAKPCGHVRRSSAGEGRAVSGW